MSERFESYKDAFNAAVKLARELNREVGLIAQTEYGRKGFNVFLLPRKENRYGHELRTQVVHPSESLMG